MSAMELGEDNAIASTSSGGNVEQFNIGDMVWAKLATYPLWPAIVCIDPDSKTHTKGSINDKKTFSLHVRFCNDKGRRGWMKIIENYYGKDNLLQKYPNYLNGLKITKKVLEAWNLAITEADDLLKFEKAERWENFSNTYKINKPPVKPKKRENDDSNKKVPQKKPRKSRKKDFMRFYPCAYEEHFDAADAIANIPPSNTCDAVDRSIVEGVELLEAEGIAYMMKALKLAGTAGIASCSSAPY